MIVLQTTESKVGHAKNRHYRNLMEIALEYFTKTVTNILNKIMLLLRGHPSYLLI